MSDEQQPLRYAQVVNGVVAMVIEATEDPDGTNGQWLACGDAGPGWLHDGEAFAAPPAPTPRRWVTKLAFRNRFTLAEKTALELASLHNAAIDVDAPANLQAAAIRAQLADQRDATYIDLARADTRAGVQALESAGLLNPGRATEILDAAIQPQEVYQP